MPRDDAHDPALDPRTMTPEWYARETRLAHMLPYVSLVDDQTVRTRVNELFRCIRLEGINSYTTDDAYLDKVTALFARIVAQHHDACSFRGSRRHLPLRPRRHGQPAGLQPLPGWGRERSGICSP